MSRLAAPRLAEWILRLILRTPDREYILGDLAQQYHARRVAGARARLWYWSQLFRAFPAMARRFIGGSCKSLVGFDEGENGTVARVL